MGGFGARKRRIALIGGIKFKARDYKYICELLLRSSNPERIEIVLSGGGQDYERLKSMISSYGLDKSFNFLSSDGNHTDYSKMFSLIASSDFLLTAFRLPSRYHNLSISSTLNYAVGFRKPLIQDPMTQDLYRVPGIVLDQGCSKLGLDDVLSMTESSCAGFISSFDEIRSRHDEESLQSLARIFEL